jgi:hypothetical protein
MFFLHPKEIITQSLRAAAEGQKKEKNVYIGVTLSTPTPSTTISTPFVGSVKTKSSSPK